MRSTPHFEKGQSFTASDASNWSCNGSQYEFIAFLACLKVSTGSGEGSGIDNSIVSVTVCTGSSEEEAEGIGPLGSLRLTLPGWGRFFHRMVCLAACSGH